MTAFQHVVLVLDLLATFLFAIGYFVAESAKVAPRTKAKAGVLLASTFLAFLFLLALFAVLSAVQKRNALPLGLLFFVLMPFAIGRLVSYRTLGFYTAVQILTLLASAATLCVL